MSEHVVLPLIGAASAIAAAFAWARAHHWRCQLLRRPRIAVRARRAR